MSSNNNNDDDDLFKNFNKISKNDIEYGPVCGQGSFGQIRIARWKGEIVAIKSFHYKQNFLAEIKHFPQVEHPNIIKLFGICPKNSLLVLEYAENGSLHHILHERPDVEYNLSHAINWCLQSARGVSYLHSLKPKPLMHRDLKPPNLLVFENGRRVKLCDFGTLRMVDTEVTNQKGSAAWMAPEVFQTKSYTEKCDVYSWSIILWEVLSRKKPYEEITESYRIFWVVASGYRPPFLRDCPEVLQKLMARCWDHESSRRPDIQAVENIMQKLFDIFIDENDPNRSTYLNIPNKQRSTNDSDEYSRSSFPMDTSDQPLSSTESHINFPNTSPMEDGSISSPQSCDSGLGPDTFEDLDSDDLEKLLSPDLIPTRPNIYSEISIKLYENHKAEAKKYLRKYFEFLVLKENRAEMIKQRSVKQDENRVDKMCKISTQDCKRILENEKELYTTMAREKRTELKQLKSSQNHRQFANNNGWVMVDKFDILE